VNIINQFQMKKKEGEECNERGIAATCKVLGTLRTKAAKPEGDSCNPSAAVIFPP
jgi:hypothetical protein